ncbi:MAG: hypothetical protein UT61_C0012G0032 [Candidatus Woesebacteria bacterium GW2011_GWA1_39_8]|jgi:hypothetical protein|uniref:Uncharacterized protein n=1 Tax=Candidatus Woesebacteria bacterium GW2011_GWA1_39_8 TaxID=1618552 RepID=A0A0G0SX59_9BACT|nr:MAG: hypothetical protein UT61_C0012G0032 [Candidatus Woesebacteria bacterium GW2011_GWA1_39_8]
MRELKEQFMLLEPNIFGGSGVSGKVEKGIETSDGRPEPQIKVPSGVQEDLSTIKAAQQSPLRPAQRPPVV